MQYLIYNKYLFIQNLYNITLLCFSAKHIEILYAPLFYRDASWELEPNAFQELLYRHDRCDAVTCLCPKGRTYTSMNA